MYWFSCKSPLIHGFLIFFFGLVVFTFGNVFVVLLMFSPLLFRVLCLNIFSVPFFSNFVYIIYTYSFKGNIFPKKFFGVGYMSYPVGLFYNNDPTHDHPSTFLYIIWYTDLCHHVHVVFYTFLYVSSLSVPDLNSPFIVMEM